MWIDHYNFEVLFQMTEFKFDMIFQEKMSVTTQRLWFYVNWEYSRHTPVFTTVRPGSFYWLDIHVSCMLMYWNSYQNATLYIWNGNLKIFLHWCNKTSKSQEDISYIELPVKAILEDILVDWNNTVTESSRL